MPQRPLLLTAALLCGCAAPALTEIKAGAPWRVTVLARGLEDAARCISDPLYSDQGLSSAPAAAMRLFPERGEAEVISRLPGGSIFAVFALRRLSAQRTEVRHYVPKHYGMTTMLGPGGESLARLVDDCK